MSNAVHQVAGLVARHTVAVTDAAGDGLAYVIEQVVASIAAKRSPLELAYAALAHLMTANANDDEILFDPVLYDAAITLGIATPSNRDELVTFNAAVEAALALFSRDADLAADLGADAAAGGADA